MTGDYPFPDDIRNPNRTKPNPFAAEDPTVDSAAPDSRGRFTPRLTATEYRPEYEAYLTDRATLAFGLAVVGLLTSLSGWIPMFDLASREFDALYIMPLLSLAASLPAILIAISNLRAMRSGAMQTDRRQLAQVGCFLGALALTNTLLYCFYIWMSWNDWW